MCELLCIRCVAIPRKYVKSPTIISHKFASSYGNDRKIISSFEPDRLLTIPSCIQHKTTNVNTNEHKYCSSGEYTLKVYNCIHIIEGLQRLHILTDG